MLLSGTETNETSPYSFDFYILIVVRLSLDDFRKSSNALLLQDAGDALNTPITLDTTSDKLFNQYTQCLQMQEHDKEFFQMSDQEGIEHNLNTKAAKILPKTATRWLACPKCDT